MLEGQKQAMEEQTAKSTPIFFRQQARNCLTFSSLE
jgi:hypothetical protein